MLCKRPRILHTTAMRCPWRLIGIGLLAVLASCTSNELASSGGSTYQPSGTGPFDSRGNYIESWADTPSKWHRRSTPKPPPSTAAPKVEPPLLASNEPATPGGSIAPPEPVKASTLAKGPKPAAATNTSETVKKTTSSSEPKPKTTAATSESAKPKSTAGAEDSSKPKPKPKPKSSSSGTKSKKSGPVRVTVKPGDSLWSLAKKHHTTVAAIQKANGLKGDMIRDGKKLIIPRY